MDALTAETGNIAAKSAARGYIQPHALHELWFHTGTACNLACPFCLEGSKPGDRRLGRVTLAEVQPFIDEAMNLGVRQLSFTGGEPFIVKDFIGILDYALQRAPCLVLTNGVDAVTKRLQQLLPLRARAHPLSLRVSIDSPYEERHDAGRGAGNFIKALASVRTLANAGFKVSVARQMEKGEDRVAVDARFAALFGEHGIPSTTPLVFFPDFGIPGTQAQVPVVTENCMTTFQTEASRREFMCAYSKMVVKRGGRMRVYACTLVDDDTDYDQGATLAESLPVRVMLRHHRCFSCFKYGASCSETKGH